MKLKSVITKEVCSGESRILTATGNVKKKKKKRLSEISIAIFRAFLKDKSIVEMRCAKE